MQVKGTPRPYGNPEVIGTPLVIDREHAVIVHEIFPLYANDMRTANL